MEELEVLRVDLCCESVVREACLTRVTGGDRDRMTLKGKTLTQDL